MTVSTVTGSTVLAETSERDWCISHLCNCALVDAFGTALHIEKSRNPDVRTLLSKTKKVIEHVNKSPSTKIHFIEIQLQQMLSSLTLHGDVRQRWKSTVSLLERFLKLWNIIRHTFSEQNKAFELESDHLVLLQLYALMRPVADLITTSQVSGSIGPPHVLLGLIMLSCTILNVSADLEVINPADESVQNLSHRNCIQPRILLVGC